MEEMETTRKLMVGVLVSSKTLAGQTNKYPNRYPKVERIAEIFQDHPAALNLIHYNTDEPETLSKQLRYIVEYSGLNLHGFQLNVVWPSVAEIEHFHAKTDRKYRLVLQVGAKAMMKCDSVNRTITSSIARYKDLVDDILIDPSGGKGQSFNPEAALYLLREIKERDFDINLGIAGGLGPDRMMLIEPLLDEFPDLNIDAEGRLRTEQDDDLDVEIMCAYLTQAQQWFATTDKRPPRSSLIKSAEPLSKVVERPRVGNYNMGPEE
jgi:phosphoribosylanthranilate isomerase